MLSAMHQFNPAKRRHGQWMDGTPDLRGDRLEAHRKLYATQRRVEERRRREGIRDQVLVSVSVKPLRPVFSANELKNLERGGAIADE